EESHCTGCIRGREKIKRTGEAKPFRCFAMTVLSNQARKAVVVFTNHREPRRARLTLQKHLGVRRPSTLHVNQAEKTRQRPIGDVKGLTKFTCFTVRKLVRAERHSIGRPVSLRKPDLAWNPHQLRRG